MTPRRPSAAALDTLDQLRADPNLAGARVEVLHGRLPPEVKDGVMLAFTEGAIDVLVATTVVEVGVPHYARTVGSPTGARPSVVFRAVRDFWRLRLRLWVNPGRAIGRGEPILGDD